MKTLLAFLVLICAVQVKTQSDGDTRLVDGWVRSNGRVEVYYQGRWGTVCDDGFDEVAAQVVCQSAGFSGARPTLFNLAFYVVPGTGIILLDEVRCRGDESNILQCSHQSIGTNDCSHGEDVRVDCYGHDLGKVAELQNGTNTDGVLVLTYGGISGTVCFNGFFGQTASRVVCRMLGYGEPDISPLILNRTVYGASPNMPVLMAWVECRGTENDLSECTTLSTDAVNDCDHDSDIAIDCLGGRHFSVTLTKGNSTYGELQLAYKGDSGPLCGSNIPAKSIQVYCHMLGFNRHYGVQVGVSLGNSTTGFVYSTNCLGYEKNILECYYHNAIRVGQCSTTTRIACLPYSDIDVRLTRGNSTYGLLEVQHSGTWGTVCDDGFDRNAVNVFCRMLNLPSTDATFHNYRYPGFHRAPILLDDIRCTGIETHVNECYHRRFGEHNCVHDEDVWIHCK